MDIIPSFYSSEAMGGDAGGGLLPRENIYFRFGEVKAEILPDSQESRSGLYREYEVLAEHYANGSATHRMYHNCVVLNSLCGLADHSVTSLRTSDTQEAKLGNGSRVYLLCVEGNDARAVIIGGPQQAKDASKGAHQSVEFNGVSFEVFDDGSWSLTNRGKTANDGSLHKDADTAGAGTVVKVEANGNFTVKTQNGKCLLSIDHKSGSIEIKSDSQVTINTTKAVVNATTVDVNASKISLDSNDVGLGSGASQSAVKGDALVSLLSQAFSIIGATLPTIPQQMALAGVASQSGAILSSTVKVGG
jgi:hypothetical protein